MLKFLKFLWKHRKQAIELTVEAIEAKNAIEAAKKK